MFFFHVVDYMWFELIYLSATLWHIMYSDVSELVCIDEQYLLQWSRIVIDKVVTANFVHFHVRVKWLLIYVRVSSGLGQHRTKSSVFYQLFGIHLGKPKPNANQSKGCVPQWFIRFCFSSLKAKICILHRVCAARHTILLWKKIGASWRE